MATATKTVPEKKKEPAKLADRIKSQINQAALKGKITVEELNDLQQHLAKVSGLIA